MFGMTQVPLEKWRWQTRPVVLLEMESYCPLTDRVELTDRVKETEVAT